MGVEYQKKIGKTFSGLDLVLKKQVGGLGYHYQAG